MKYIERLLIIIAASLSVVSCLDQYPDDAIKEDNAITTLDEADQAVIGIYSDFKSGALYSGLLTLLPDIQADLVYAVDGFTNTYGNFWRWEILPTDTDVEAVYGALYSIIGSCNFFFDYNDRLRETLKSDQDFKELESLEGEVYFARALAYSELIKLYCKAYEPETADKELGVALVKSYHNPGKLKRASLKDSYAFVLEDLEKAAEKIELENTNNSLFFCKSAAYALMARVYLYMQDWDNAVKYSSKVIEDKYLGLSSVKVAAPSPYSNQSEYQYMWTGDNAREIIWRIGFTPTSYGGALGQVFLNYNQITYYPDYVPADWALGLYAKTDLRYDIFFAQLQTGYAHGLNYPLLIKYQGNVELIQNNIYHVNMPKVLRLSEQYLIRAEAYCRKGDYGKAAKDITTLRTARYSTYGTTVLTKDDWLDTISEERVRELYMEGFRLQDLKRWHMGFERKPQTSSVKEGSSLKINADNPLFVWPIPQHELNSPDSEIEPNESNR